VLNCARRTGCFQTDSTDCYCGAGTDLTACKADPANAVGACKGAITAGNPPGATSAQIVAALADVTVPAGNAMNLIQCDYSYCGDPSIGGASQCAPFCNDPITAAECPFLVGVTVSPLSAGVGETIDIGAQTTIPGGILSWTTGPGEDGIFDPAFTQYTCVSAGPKNLTVVLTKAGTTCLDSITVPITCV
jgi:hypothetical protein